MIGSDSVAVVGFAVELVAAVVEEVVFAVAAFAVVAAVSAVGLAAAVGAAGFLFAVVGSAVVLIAAAAAAFADWVGVSVAVAVAVVATAVPLPVEVGQQAVVAAVERWELEARSAVSSSGTGPAYEMPTCPS